MLYCDQTVRLSPRLDTALARKYLLTFNHLEKHKSSFGALKNKQLAQERCKIILKNRHVLKKIDEFISNFPLVIYGRQIL